MSDLILNLPHYHRHVALRSADNKHDFRPYVSFTGFAFYIAVRCGFDKHLYLTSCLNAHNHNTCNVRPKQDVLRKKLHSSLLFKITKQKYLPLIPWQPL